MSATRTITIELPEAVAANAEAKGLLEQDAIERLIREELRRQAWEYIQKVRDEVAVEETPELIEESVALVKAVRAERALADRS